MGKSMGKTWKKRRTKGRKRRKKYEWQLGSKKKTAENHMGDTKPAKEKL